jgi:hypothetical protein
MVCRVCGNKGPNGSCECKVALPTVEFNVKTTMPGEVSSESLLPPPQ